MEAQTKAEVQTKAPTLTWREKFVVRILLILARMFVDDPVIAQELKNLTTEVNVTR